MSFKNKTFKELFFYDDCDDSTSLLPIFQLFPHFRENSEIAVVHVQLSLLHGVPARCGCPLGLYSSWSSSDFQCHRSNRYETSGMCQLLIGNVKNDYYLMKLSNTVCRSFLQCLSPNFGVDWIVRMLSVLKICYLITLG